MKRKPSNVVHLPVGRIVDLNYSNHYVITYACRPNAGLKMPLPPIPEDTSMLRRCKACEKAIISLTNSYHDGPF